MGILRSLVHEDYHQAVRPPVIILMSLWFSLLATLPFIGGSPPAEILLWYHEFGRYDPSAMDGVIWNTYIWQKFQVAAGIIIGSLPWILPKIAKSARFLILGPSSLNEYLFPKIKKILFTHLLLTLLAGLSTLCLFQLLAFSFSSVILIQLIFLGLLTMIWVTLFTVFLQIVVGNPLCSLFVSLSILTTLSHPSFLIKLNGLNPLSLSLSVISSGSQNNLLLFATYCILLLGFISFTLVGIYLAAEHLHERTAIRLFSRSTTTQISEDKSREVLRCNSISAAMLVPLSLIYTDYQYPLIGLYVILTYWSIFTYILSVHEAKKPDGQRADFSQFLLLTPTDSNYLKALTTRQEIKVAKYIVVIPHLIVLASCTFLSKSAVYFLVGLCGVVLCCECTLMLACLIPRLFKTQRLQSAFLACSLVFLAITFVLFEFLIGSR
jgi:hypothetical protein